MNPTKPWHHRALTYLAVFLIAAGVACRPFANEQTATPPPDIQAVVAVWAELAQVPFSSEAANPIVEVWNSLSSQFVEKNELDAAALSRAAIDAMRHAESQAAQAGQSLDPADLSEAAIDGMLAALDDPYTNFLNSEEYQLYMQNSHGEFEGIGARVNEIDGQIIITEPLPDTPAERAGIRAGDVILEVDGDSTLGWGLLATVLRIRGPKGTQVQLLMQHPDDPTPRLLEVVRGVIPVVSVDWEMLEMGIAYLYIGSFTETTDEEVKTALKEILDQGAQGLVLDLRGNSGGLLSSTVTVASQFLKDGLVLYAADGDGKRTDYKVEQGGLATDIPMVVLANRFSASASEVLSAALQDHERAVLIGTRTFGKGSVNLPKRLSDGSGLYFTIGRWYSPNGRMIEGEGLQPDILVERTILLDSIDQQLDAAIAHLTASFALSSSR